MTSPARSRSATPPLGDVQPAMAMDCGYGWPGPLCGQPAVWHIIWTPDTENSIACEKHAQEAESRWTRYDRHPLTETCGMPDSTVVWSWDDPPGKCLWMVSEETLALAEAAALVPVGTSENTDYRQEESSESG